MIGRNLPHAETITGTMTEIALRSVKCATCGGTPDVRSRASRFDDEVIMVFECHGEACVVGIPMMEPEKMVRIIPRLVFLRRWVRHGEVTASARRERRALVADGRRVA